MSKFTPGPWVAHISKVDEITGNDVMLIRSERPMRGIVGIEIEREEDEANARLIATAPEMFELLCDILGHQSKLSPELQHELKRIIARAEGK